MAEVTIQYSDPKTLKFLKEVAKYFDFEILKPKTEKATKKVVKTDKATPISKREITYINGMPVLLGDPSVNIDEMTEIVTRNNMDAKKLREKAWDRKK